MNFLIQTGTPLDLGEPRARALQVWRNAEELVTVRWSAYLKADGEARPVVFAAYMAALDAEAAAADELARTSLRAAA